MLRLGFNNDHRRQSLTLQQRWRLTNAGVGPDKLPGSTLVKSLRYQSFLTPEIKAAEEGRPKRWNSTSSFSEAGQLMFPSFGLTSWVFSNFEIRVVPAWHGSSRRDLRPLTPRAKLDCSFLVFCVRCMLGFGWEPSTTPPDSSYGTTTSTLTQQSGKEKIIGEAKRKSQSLLNVHSEWSKCRSALIS